MPLGEGKYNAIARQVLRRTDADGVILIVINGNRGHGFACETDAATLLTLPEILEDLAKQIRKDQGNA